MVIIIGDVEPQASAVAEAVPAIHNGEMNAAWFRDADAETIRAWQPNLIVVAGWRHMVPPEVLALAPTIGFHSARLPEYPGRAPVYWTLLRGDEYVHNTMLFLTEEPDAGDIIDTDSRRIRPDDTPETLYEWIAESDARMLRRHLPALLAGTAPRYPQDRSKRGPLTTADGYEKWRQSQLS